MSRCIYSARQTARVTAVYSLGGSNVSIVHLDVEEHPNDLPGTDSPRRFSKVAIEAYTDEYVFTKGELMSIRVDACVKGTVEYSQRSDGYDAGYTLKLHGDVYTTPTDKSVRTVCAAWGGNLMAVQLTPDEWKTRLLPTCESHMDVLEWPGRVTLTISLGRCMEWE